MRKLPTRERLMELFDYNPITGAFTRRVRVAHQRVGVIAGCPDVNGYLVIVVDGVPCKAHRLAWLYMTGKQPPALIDHANRRPDDNAWCNLREATRAQNHANSRIKSSNTSGLRGVVFEKNIGKWGASIRYDGLRKRLGFFCTPEEASEVYELAVMLIHGEYANV